MLRRIQTLNTEQIKGLTLWLEEGFAGGVWLCGGIDLNLYLNCSFLKGKSAFRSSYYPFNRLNLRKVYL